jgi:dephospho-CoA kinase
MIQWREHFSIRHPHSQITNQRENKNLLSIYPMTSNPPTSPIIIGLTGNIGVGKSTVLGILRKLGAQTIDADKVSHGVMLPGGLAYDAVIEAFGPEILLSDGSINRRHLANIVFAFPDKLARLEDIVHPAVEQAVQAEIEAADAPVVVIEAIKLLEGELKSICDEIWVVTAPEDVQIARLIEQRGLSERQARGRMRSQSSQEWKASQADVVIVNDKDLSALEEQVAAAWKAMLERHREKTNVTFSRSA